MYMKVCTKCKVEKELSGFNKDKTRVDGLFPQCRVCKKKGDSDSYLRNRDVIIEKSKKWATQNTDKRTEYRKKYNIINKENHSKKCKEWYSKNKPKVYEYYKKRISSDPLYKLRCNIAGLIRISIKNKGYTKKSKTNEILGCTFEEFKTHIENQFIEGMSWDNRNKWQLDHIYPVSLAKDEEELIKLNHYTNFQPLWSEDNRRKSNKINN